MAAPYAHRRTPGQQRAGDAVLLQGLQARPELNGQHLFVLGLDVGSADSWQSENPGLLGHVALSMQAANARYVLTHKGHASPEGRF